ncbi:uncharacterized protein LOC135826219 [Sycon ciliatum]|uniref:uncharacterized protein LOC135826219 n=1 Tax=Sycon ciliatum TaxID=27933 RepID=UPI0031F6EDA0
MKQFRTCMSDLLEERMETVLDSIARIREEVSAVSNSFNGLDTRLNILERRLEKTDTGPLEQAIRSQGEEIRRVAASTDVTCSRVAGGVPGRHPTSLYQSFTAGASTARAGCGTWKFNPPKKSSGNDKAHSSSNGGSGDGNDNAHSSSDGGSGDDSSGNDCGSGGGSSSDGGSGDGNDNAHSSRDDGSGDDSSGNDCGRSGSSSRRNSSSDSSPKPGAELTRTPGQKSRPHQRGSPAEDQAAKRVAPVSKQ